MLVKHLLAQGALPLVALHVTLRSLAYNPALLERLLLSTLAVLSAVWLSRWARERRNVAKMNELGAERVFVLPSRLFLSVDVMYALLTRFYSEPIARYWQKAMSKHGSNTINTGVLGQDVIVTSDWAVMKHALTGPGFAVWGKGAFMQAIFADFLGSGVFATDGAIAAAHRAMARPYFTREKITDYATFERHTAHFVQVIESLQARSGGIDFQDLAGRFSLDAATEFLMSGSLNSLGEAELIDDASAHKTSMPSTSFLKAFNAVQDNCYRRSMLGVAWPLRELFGNKNTQPMIVINSLVESLIEKALINNKPLEDGTPLQNDHETLLDHLISETRDTKVLKDQVLNVLLAARDTTATTLSCSIYMLARNPLILKKLRDEIMSQVTAEPGDMITPEMIKSCSYLRAFINEILRLFPPVPINLRTASTDDVIPTATGQRLFVPKGARLVYLLYTMQRRTDLWGEDAKTFDPDRWLDDRNSHYLQQPFIWQPFSAGPRLCLGQQFAYNEVSYSLIRLLQAYKAVELDWEKQPKESWYTDIEEGETERGILLNAQITLLFKGGLHVKFTKA